MKYVYEKENNYNLHNIEIDKFKTIQIDIRFIEEVKKENLTYRSILPYVLKAASKKYPSKASIRLKLQDLYGSGLSVSAVKQGNLSIVGFSFAFIDELYIDESLNQEIVNFIEEIIFNPLVKNDSFDENIFNEEVRLLKDEFNSIKDNKSKYAYERMKEIMFSEENYRFSSLGIYEDLEKMTSRDLYNYYLEFLNNHIEIVINGNKNNLSELLKKLPFKGNCNMPNPIDLETKEIKEIKKVIECQKIKQAKLCIGYRTNIRIKDRLHYPMIMANCILGGYPHSKLFRIVREKNSLAYSIYSRFDAYKGNIVITAGIDDEHLDKTLELIEYCIKELQTNITQEEFDMTKKSLINDYLEMLDSQNAMSTKAFNMCIVNDEFDLNKSIDDIKKVTIEEIYEASKLINLDTIYCLGCEKNEDN